MHRRAAIGVIGLAGLGTFGAGFLVGTGSPAPLPTPPRRLGHRRAVPRPFPAAVALPPRFFEPHLTKAPTPHGTITALPKNLAAVALTIDDGANTAVVAAYAKLALETGLRLTFFLNGSRPSWTENAPALRTLAQSGQVQMANHTWSHSNLRKLSRDRIISELMTNHDFIKATYGVDARPYFRPPYGYHNHRVDSIAASVGYTVPVMWYGSLSDATLITDAQLMDSANRWLLPGHIVIGHANHATVTGHFAELIAIIRNRGLTPVTLNDVFTRQ